MSDNRYRIFEQVPKNKAKEGRGSRIVERIVRTLKHKTDVRVTVRFAPIPRYLNALTHTTVLPQDLPKTGIYYEITWRENNV